MTNKATFPYTTPKTTTKQNNNSNQTTTNSENTTNFRIIFYLPPKQKMSQQQQEQQRQTTTKPTAMACMSLHPMDAFLSAMSGLCKLFLTQTKGRTPNSVHASRYSLRRWSVSRWGPVSRWASVSRWGSPSQTPGSEDKEWNVHSTSPQMCCLFYFISP